MNVFLKLLWAQYFSFWQFVLGEGKRNFCSWISLVTSVTPFPPIWDFLLMFGLYLAFWACLTACLERGISGVCILKQGSRMLWWLGIAVGVRMNASAPGGLPQGAQYLKHWYWGDGCLPVYADGKVSIPSYGDRGSWKHFLTWPWLLCLSFSRCVRFWQSFLCGSLRRPCFVF